MESGQLSDQTNSSRYRVDNSHPMLIIISWSYHGAGQPTCESPVCEVEQVDAGGEGRGEESHGAEHGAKYSDCPPAKPLDQRAGHNP